MFLILRQRLRLVCAILHSPASNSVRTPYVRSRNIIIMNLSSCYCVNLCIDNYQFYIKVSQIRLLQLLSYTLQDYNFIINTNKYLFDITFVARALVRKHSNIQLVRGTVYRLTTLDLFRHLYRSPVQFGRRNRYFNFFVGFLFFT